MGWPPCPWSTAGSSCTAAAAALGAAQKSTHRPVHAESLPSGLSSPYATAAASGGSLWTTFGPPSATPASSYASAPTASMPPPANTAMNPLYRNLSGGSRGAAPGGSPGMGAFDVAAAGSGGPLHYDASSPYFVSPGWDVGVPSKCHAVPAAAAAAASMPRPPFLDVRLPAASDCAPPVARALAGQGPALCGHAVRRHPALPEPPAAATTHTRLVGGSPQCPPRRAAAQANVTTPTDAPPPFALTRLAKMQTINTQDLSCCTLPLAFAHAGMSALLNLILAHQCISSGCLMYASARSVELTV